MSDLRMRALDDAQIAMYQAWGSSGTIVPWGEVPAGLQTGVIDGYLNSPFVPVMFGQTDFVKNFADGRCDLAAARSDRVQRHGMMACPMPTAPR